MTPPHDDREPAPPTGSRGGPAAPESAPPRPARWLARLSCAREDRDLLIADLAERFDALASARGASAARRWYWSQALRGLVARLWPDPSLVVRWSWRGALGDVRQALRVLRRRPAYAAGVVGTLGLGLASAAAVGGVAWHVWLAPLPFPDPGRIVRLHELEPAPEAVAAEPGARTRWRISPPLLEDLRAHRWATLEAVAGATPNAYDWTRDGRISRVRALSVSPELFAILGLGPMAGRWLSADPDAAEVVLTEPFWRSAFGADPAAVSGASMTLDGRAYRVVGIVGAPAPYPGAPDLFTRLSFGSGELVEGMRGARYLDVVARIRPTHGVTDAAAELEAFVRALGETHPNHRGWGGEAVRLSDELVRPYRAVLGLLTGAGFLFLALSLVNVAGLVAARTAEAREDRSVRLALGASEGRLLRGSTVESLLLGLLASGLALVLAQGLLEPITALAPAEVPRLDRVRIGPRLGLAVLLLGVVGGCGVGALAYALSRGATPAIGRSRPATRPGLPGRGVLVAGQIALTTLLATAGVGVLKRAAELQRVDLGFRPEGVVVAPVALGADRYPTPQARLRLWSAVREAGAARGLEVAVATNPPMAGVNMPWGFRSDPAAEQAFAQYHVVSPEYFGTLGVEVVEGRPLTEEDERSGEGVAVVNETLAVRHFPGRSAVGETVRLLDVPKRVVGVVGSTRHFGPADEAPAEIYLPLAHDPRSSAHLLVRGEGEGVAAGLAQVLDAVDPALGAPPPAPYTAYVAEWFATLRLQVVIVGVLAAVGTALAGLGLYALMAYRVGTRRREIGVRIALGASETRVFSEVVRSGARLSTVGLALGILAWLAAVPVAAPLLGDVDPRDPYAPMAVAILVALVSLGASALPAHRSARVDPAVTLRSE